MTVDLNSVAVNADVHGGSCFFDEMLMDQGATVIMHLDDATVYSIDPAQTETPAPVKRTWRQRLGSVLWAARAALACVREAVGWLADSATRGVRRRAYSGRHRVVEPVSHRIQRTILGRERSTSEFSRAVQRRSQEPRTEEGELVFQPGDTFVGWVAAALESMRELEHARRHTPEHGRWLCS